MDPRAVQRFVHVYVAQAADDSLVQQQRLQTPAAPAQPRCVRRAAAAEHALARGALEAIGVQAHRDQVGEIDADAAVEG